MIIIDFLQEVHKRNEPMFWFGAINLLAAIVFMLLSRVSNIEYAGVSAWYKPFKFAASIWIYCWSMAWYCYYLPAFNVTFYNVTVVVLFGFEIFYIALQAARGQASHFNVSTTVYSVLYGLMAFAATAVTLYTAYIGYLFFVQDLSFLPGNYLWGIRLGIIIFVIFSLEGFVMGSRMSHTIGGPDGASGIPVLNWSTKFGDARIAHFVGMHALQIIPLLAFYVLRNNLAVFSASCFYLALACLVLIQALQGKPIYKSKSNSFSNETVHIASKEITP